MSENRDVIQIEQPDVLNVNKPLLDKPVLCLSLDAQPIEPVSAENGISPKEMRLRARLRPKFTPLLITDQDISYYAFEDVELVDFYGPFKVYEVRGSIYNPESAYRDREGFREGRPNLMNWCHVPPMDVPLMTAPQEENPAEGWVPDIPEKKTVLPAPEAVKLRNQLADALDTEVIARIKEVSSITDSPRALLDGLTQVVHRLSDWNIHDRLLNFSQENLEPLRDFAGKEVARLASLGNEHLEDVFESLVGLEGFDIVLEMIKSQSQLLAEIKYTPSHKGILIPFAKFEGTPSFSPNANLQIQDGEMVIQTNGDEYRFPLPQRQAGAEICFKGGLARTVAKIALGEDVSGELPIHDVDLVVFGKGGMPLKAVAAKYQTDVRDIEKMENPDYGQYCASRDSTLNEVLVTPDGVFISFNALSSMYQGNTQTADDRTSESLFNKHTFFIYRQDTVTGEKEVSEQFRYVGKERFPSPVVLSRMFKLLIDDKCEGVVVPEGIRKTDIGVYWLVIARKILSEADPKIRQTKMERMLTLAKFVESPYYTKLPAREKADPEAFLKKLKDAYPDFDMEGSLSDKDTILWVVHKLRNQILRAFMNSVGQSQEKNLQRMLEPSDFDLEILTLPPLEAYGLDAQKKKEMGLAEKQRTQKIREVDGVFQNFTTEPDTRMLQAEHTIRNYIGVIYLGTEATSLDLGKMYFIPVAKREDFLKALKETGYSAGTKASGVSFAVYDTKISAVFLDENEPITKTSIALFEELFHASGLKIAGKRGARMGYSVTQFNQEQKQSETTFLEEAMAGLEWKVYKDQQIAAGTELGRQLQQGIILAQRTQIINGEGMIETFNEDVPELSADFVTFIENTNSLGLVYIHSPSSHAGEVLDRIITACGKEQMLQLMRQARRGDVSSIREVAKRIEQTFGRGSYAQLLKTPARDISAIEALRAVFAINKTKT